METFVISLSRTPQRYRQFAQANAAHANVIRVDAEDGRQHPIEDLQASRIVSGELMFTPGAIGNALSHRKLWQHAIERNESITVCEDDALLHDDFQSESQRLLSSLHGAWDLVMWGWNFDAILLANAQTPLSAFLIQCNQDEMRGNKMSYLRRPVQPTLLRLRGAFGTVCYSISAQGARKFMKMCFPLKQSTLSFPEINFYMPVGALDAVMCMHYTDALAFVSFPPLAVTDNDHGASTVQTEFS